MTADKTARTLCRKRRKRRTAVVIEEQDSQVLEDVSSDLVFDRVVVTPRILH